MTNRVEELTAEENALLLRTLEGVLFTVLSAHGIKVSNPKITGMEIDQDDEQSGIGGVHCVYVNGQWVCN